MPKRTPGPFETTMEHYYDKEEIRPGMMADYIRYLNDDEKRFFKSVVEMYEDPAKSKMAADTALGIIEARRINEQRTPEREIKSFRRGAEDLLTEGFGAVGKSVAESIYGKRSPGDRMPLAMIEGQKLAQNLGQEAMYDDDFMKLSIAQIIEESGRPEPSIGDKAFKMIRDADLFGLDDTRSPYGVFSEPTPPPGAFDPDPEGRRKRKKK